MRIGLIPMAAKPYHKGHHALVELAALENNLVKIFVSSGDRFKRKQFPIYGLDMIQVWEKHIKQILPRNVEVFYVNVPVGSVYDELEGAEANESQNEYTVYTDPVDISAYSKSYRLRYFPKLYGRGQIKFKAEENPKAVTRGMGTPAVSGTKIREFLKSNDFNSFAENMPNHVDAKSIWDLFRHRTELNDPHLHN